MSIPGTHYPAGLLPPSPMSAAMDDSEYPKSPASDANEWRGAWGVTSDGSSSSKGIPRVDLSLALRGHDYDDGHKDPSAL